MSGYVRAPGRASGATRARAVKVVRARELRREATSAERAFWVAVRRNALGVPCRRQHVLLGWIVDFYLPAAALVIELDGGVHEDQVEADVERDQALAAFGLEILRIPNEAILTNLPGVLTQLRERVARRAGGRREPLP